MAHALLIGNGINQLSRDAPSWRSLLHRLTELAGRPELMENWEVKPFSLLYEEIAMSDRYCSAQGELELKRLVSETVGRIPENTYHRSLLTLPVRHILTTNYDYCIESASTEKQARSNLSHETKYSVFRNRTVGSIRVWHIHGELDAPNSIMLGHEQYSGQLQKLRDYATADRKSRKRLKSPFKLNRLDFEKTERVYSWVDVFLRDDVHIVGLSLDYVEIDLWWLLAYKRKLQRSKGYMTGRTIYYDFTTKPRDNRIDAKYSILQSLGVDVRRKEIRPDEYEIEYQHFIERFPDYP